jgi:hypothetical protein
MEFSYIVLFLDEKQQFCVGTMFIYRSIDSINR